MYSFAAAFVLALVVSLGLTPVVRALALRWGAVSLPGGGRHLHREQIPRVGGIAIALSVCTPVAALLLVDSGVGFTVQQRPELTAGLLAGGLLLCATGTLDDLRGLRPAYKLLVQVVAACVAFYVGFRIEAVRAPFFGTLSMGVFALPVTVIWIVGITNAVNLIDGLDGLAAGVVFFASTTNFIVALIHGSTLVALLMVTLMGAMLGFLVFNFNPARIFMGDSGSYFLGFVIACSSIYGALQKASVAVALLAPVVALGVPIFDTLFSIVRRRLERRPMFAADRGHIHHRLIDMGLTQRRAVLLLYGVSVLLTAGAVVLALGRTWEAGVALLLAFGVMVGLVRFVGYFEYVKQRLLSRSRVYDRQTEALRRLLPQVPRLLQGARSDADVWEVLSEIGRRAGLDEVIVIEPGLESREAILAWKARAGQAARDRVSVHFTLQRRSVGALEIVFIWVGESAAASPEAEILLRVVVDLVESALEPLDNDGTRGGSHSEDRAGSDPPPSNDQAGGAGNVGSQVQANPCPTAVKHSRS